MKYTHGEKTTLNCKQKRWVQEEKVEGKIVRERTSKNSRKKTTQTTTRKRAKKRRDNKEMIITIFENSPILHGKPAIFIPFSFKKYFCIFQRALQHFLRIFFCQDLVFVSRCFWLLLLCNREKSVWFFFVRFLMGKCRRKVHRAYGNPKKPYNPCFQSMSMRI